MKKTKLIMLQSFLLIFSFLLSSSNGQLIPTIYPASIQVGSYYEWQITESTTYFQNHKSWGNKTGDIMAINITAVDNNTARPYTVDEYLNGKLINSNESSSFMAISTNWIYWTSIYNRSDLGWTAYFSNYSINKINYNTFTTVFNGSDSELNIKIHYDLTSGLQLYRSEYNATEKYERVLFNETNSNTGSSLVETLVVIGVLVGLTTIGVSIYYLKKPKK